MSIHIRNKLKSWEHTASTVEEYCFRPLREAVMIGVIVFVVISITTTIIYYYTLTAMKGEIREGLARTASVLALSVDGDRHRTFRTTSQENSPGYRKAVQPLVRALQADSTISFVYTVVMNEGKPYFVLDPTPPGDRNGDGIDEKSHIMQEYSDASPVMRHALLMHKTETETQPYRDNWGSSISGYAPFYDSSGAFVGIVGIDVNARNYYQRLEPIKRATVRAVVTGFFTAFIVGSLVWFIRNFSKVINVSRLRIYAELLMERQRNRTARNR